MPSSSENAFLSSVGDFLGVAPEEIRLNQSNIPGEFTLIGPRPLPSKQVPDLPTVRNYCFTFVLKTDPPPLCQAYQQEYDQLTEELAALIQAAAWDDVASTAQRLSELEAAIRNTCGERERVIRYCIFPDDWFVDPFLGERTLPPRPPIPPLTQSP